MALITDFGASSVTQSGLFIQGKTASFVLFFYDIDDNSYDPTSIDVEILDPNNVIVATLGVPVKIDTGEYGVDYGIAGDAETGVWTMRYTFVSATVSGDETRTIDENFIVVESSSQSSIYAQNQRIVMLSYLQTLIRTFQRIPVHAEQVVWDASRTKAKLTFGQWNQPAGVRVHRNNQLLTSGYEVDYLKGEIAFDTAAEKSDIIDVDYNFRWFTTSELEQFVAAGIQRVNFYPPVTNYMVGNTPQYWVFVGMWGSAVDAIRTIILDLLHQQPQIVFGGPDAAYKAVDVLDRMKQNYEEELKTALDIKKFGPYTGLTNMIVVPEYTLPGGRCLAAENIVFCLINDVFYKITVADVYTFFECDKKIKILSDKNGQTIFEPIHKIWKSGRKPLLEISAETGDKTRVSHEHIIFVNGVEKAAEDVIIGDLLNVFAGSKIIKSPVTSIIPVAAEETFDIEVPTTQNLFSDNIKCHNSRWFRYLFKGDGGG